MDADGPCQQIWFYTSIKASLRCYLYRRLHRSARQAPRSLTAVHPPAIHECHTSAGTVPTFTADWRSTS
eukprot:358247-Chlamydomonas_euryale.AAC.8